MRHAIDSPGWRGAEALTDRKIPFTVGAEGIEPWLNPVRQDEKRHRERVRRALAENLVDMVAHEVVLVSRGRQSIQASVEALREYRIRYDRPAIGAREPKEAGGAGPEDPASTSEHGNQRAGTQPGDDREDGVFTVEELAHTIFEGMVLPGLDPARLAPGDAPRWEIQDLARVGGNWAKLPTLRAHLLRRLRTGQGGYGRLEPEDLRFWQWCEAKAADGGAVVMALMDTSGSMGSFEKFMAKSFFFWTTEFLRQYYPRVDVVFIAHDVRAREVDESTFFHRGASGGTVSSSAYRLAQEILEERYPADQYNAYAFHFSDGGNLTSDNPLALEMGMALGQRVNLFGYGEIHDTDRAPSQLFQQFVAAGQPAVMLRSKADVLAALVRFFGSNGDSLRSSS